MASDARIAEAIAALDRVRPGLSNSAKQIVAGLALVESDFGDAYRSRTPDGSSSYNWGNIYAPGDRGTISIKDTSEGKPFTANAAWNSSDDAGARQLVTLLESRYEPAMQKASEGKVYEFAKALWRDGPGSSRPSYYGGFPPGYPGSLAPFGTVQGSAEDYYWRIIAYKRYVQAGAKRIAKALGQPLTLDVSEPPFGAVLATDLAVRKNVPWGWFGVTAVALLAMGGAYGWQAGWFDDKKG